MLAATVVSGAPPVPSPAEAAAQPETGEVQERRTATSRTVRNADGTLTTTSYGAPIHYRGEEGSWKEIDSELVPASGDPGYRWRNAANSFDARFADQLGEGFMAFDPGGGVVGLSLQGAAAAAGRAQGTGVGYANALPQVDLDYDVTATGVKETLTLHQAGAPSRYQFRLTPVDGQELWVDERPDGSWAFYQAPHAGPAFVLKAPFALDATDDGEASKPRFDPVSLKVRQATSDEGAGYVLDLVVDREWLSSDDRVFPVVIDPTITLAPELDGSFVANCSTCVPLQSARLPVGTDDQVYRPALRFDLDAVPPGSEVSDAAMELYYDGTCVIAGVEHCGGNDHTLQVQRIAAAWDENTTSSQLQVDSGVLDSATLLFGADEQWMDWNVTTAVQDWTDGTWGGHGFQVRSDDETISRSGPSFPSSRFQDESIRPRLEVTYVPPPTHLLEPDTIRGNGATLHWNAFEEDSGVSFDRWEIHRALGEVDFTPSGETRIATISDAGVTSYRDTTAAPERAFTYRIVVGGEVSNARTVTTAAAGQARKLLQPDPEAGRAVSIARVEFEGNVPCQNYGASDTLQVGPDPTLLHRGLVSFDLRDIPASAEINKAEMSLFADNLLIPFMTIQAHAATSQWDEGSGVIDCTGDGATWDDRAAGGVTWTTKGGDHVADPTTTRDVQDSAGWYEFDIAPLAQEWVDGTRSNHGVLLRMADEEWTGEDRRLLFRSDDTPDASRRPRLEVLYTDGNVAEAPTVTLTTPGDGDTVAGNVRLAASASDDSRVEQVEFLFDGHPVGTVTERPFEFDWDTTTFSNGRSVVLRARATDDAGNTTTSAPVVPEVANAAPPQVTLTGPAGGATVTGMLDLAADASAEAGVDRVEFTVDGLRVAEATSAPFGAQIDTLDETAPIYDGVHEITAIAYDAFGQQTTSDPVAITVDNTGGSMFQATVSSTEPPPAVVYDPETGVQQTYGVDVTATNDSLVSWPAGDVSVRARWISVDDDAPVVVEAGLEPLVGPVVPGGSDTVTVLVEAPPLPAGVDRDRYTLEFDLVADNTGGPVAFGRQGNKPHHNPVIVQKALATALGLERYYHFDAEELGAGMTHLLNVANGNSLWRWSPFSSPGRGLSTVLDLTYNSGERHSNSPAGNNVSLSISGLTRFGSSIDIHPNKADEIAGNANRFVEFTDGTGTTHRFIGHQNTDGTVWWESPPGVHLYLRSLAGDPERAWAFTRPDRVTFYYDEDGYPTSVEDGNGNRISYTLEDVPPGEDPGGAKKRITQVIDPAGQGANPAPQRSYDIAYYSKKDAKRPQLRGKIRTITDHEGRAVHFDYYEDGNLRRLTQAGGQTATGEHLPDRAFTFTYTTANGDAPAIPDPADRVDPDPRTPNQSTLLYSVADPRGAATTFGYYGPGSALDRGKLEARTDRAGATTSYDYDFTNRITTVAAPEDRDWTYDYDPFGRVTEITDPLVRTTAVVWTADHRVAQFTEPGGAVTEFDYNANGYLTERVDAEGGVTQLSYTDLPADSNDVADQWQAGRDIPHLSDLASLVEPNGNDPTVPGDWTWVFDHDPSTGNLDATTDPEDNTTAYTYDGHGQVLTSTDPNSNVTTYAAYDANGLPTEVVDAEGGTSRFAYDADGLMQWQRRPIHENVAVDDPSWARTEFVYDSFGRLGLQSSPKDASREPGELIWSAADYDPNDNLLARFDPAFGREYTPGPAWRSEFDAMDRPVESVSPNAESDPQGARVQAEYDTAGRRTVVRQPEAVRTSDPQGWSTFYDYDPLDRVIRESRFDTTGSSVEAIRTHSCYDAAGDLVAVIVPNADLATVNCDDPLPAHTSLFDYDQAHRLLSTTDADGNTTSYTYDPNGQVTATTDPEGATTSYDYDERGLVTRVDSPFDGARDLTQLFTYDAAGNRTLAVSPRAFDAAGGTGPFEDYVTQFTYDGLHRPIRTELPSDADERSDGVGPAFIHRTYDSGSRVVATSEPTLEPDPAAVGDDAWTNIDYFDPGWVRRTDDPGSPRVTTRFEHTAQGWQAARIPIDPDTGEDVEEETAKWTYHPDGLLAERGDRAGNKATYSYDANGNLTDASDGTHLVQGHPIEIVAAYDSLNRPTLARHRAADPDAEGDWRASVSTYDGNGNVIERVDDADWNPTSGEPVSGTGRENEFNYTLADRLSRHLDHGDADTDPQQITTTFDATGRETRRTIAAEGSGSFDDITQVTSWEWHPGGQLDQLITRNGDNDIVNSQQVSYLDGGVFLNGHRVAETFRRDNPDTSKPCQTATCVTAYSFDARERLTQERTTRTADNSMVTESSYQLDVAGNITEQITDGAITGFEYEGNQLQWTDPPAGPRQYQHHDARGNLACVTLDAEPQVCNDIATGDDLPQGVLAAYAWDAFDRLEAFRSFAQDPNGIEDPVPDSQATYSHDPLDRITEQSEWHDGDETSEKQTAFSYLSLTTSVVTEHQTDLDEDPITTKTYRHDAFARLVGMANTGDDPDRGGDAGTFSYVHDVHGSVTGLLDDTGAAHATYGYTAYGAVNGDLTAGDPDEHDPLNPYRYTSKRIDTGTGSIDMGARRFGPDTARFVSRDRYLGALADLGLTFDPLTGNRYALAAGNPISYIETDGHYIIDDGGGGSVTSSCSGYDDCATPYDLVQREYFSSDPDGGDVRRIYDTNARVLGGGIIVTRMYIRHDDAAGKTLTGDDRGPTSAFYAPYRVATAWNTDTGEVSYNVTASCRTGWPVGGTGCDPQQPITDGGVNSLQISEAESGRGFEAKHRALNSVLPCCEVSGSIGLDIAPDGVTTVRLRGDDYPSFEAYQYRMDGSVRTLAHIDEGPLGGALAHPFFTDRDITWIDGQRTSRLRYPLPNTKFGGP